MSVENKTTVALWGCVCWGLVEGIYYFRVRNMAKRLQPKNKPQPYWFHDPEKVVHEIYDNCSSLQSFSFEHFLTKAHLGAPLESIYTENYQSFLAWYLFMSPLNELSIEQKQVVTRLCEKAVEQFGFPCKPGYNDSISHCHLGLNTFEYVHQPLLLYGLVEGFDLVHNIVNLRYTGFRLFHANRIKYWYYHHPTSNQTPILFFHGMGAGWCSYSNIISAFAKERSVILVCYDSIVLHRLHFEVPDYKQLVNAVETILMDHSIESVSLVGHSWGTFLAGWIVKRIPHKVTHLCMIDPIATFVPYPATIYFVIYKQPDTIKDYLFHYLFRRNITISNTLSRHFAWYNMVFGFDEIPDRMGVVISLSGKDELLDVQAVKEMTQTFMNRPARLGKSRLLYWENYNHGDAKDNHLSVEGIVRAIRENESSDNNDSMTVL